MDKPLIEEVAKANQIEPQLLVSLIQVEAEKVHLERRRGIKGALRKVIEDSLEKEEGGQ